MVNTTATQNIRKPESTDDPRQLALYFQQTATDLDQRMAAHFRDLDRVLNPPFAVVRVSAPISVDASVTADGAPSSGSIPFDTVEIDTAGMADLSANAYTITLTQTGYWWVGGYARLSGFLPGASNSDVAARVASYGGGYFLDPRHDDQGGNPGSGVSGPIQVASLTTPIVVGLNVTWNGASSTNVTTVFQAELWALKVRDL